MSDRDQIDPTKHNTGFCGGQADPRPEEAPRCEKCGGPVADGKIFCENCLFSFPTTHEGSVAVGCLACGAPIANDGTCTIGCECDPRDDITIHSDGKVTSKNLINAVRVGKYLLQRLPNGQLSVFDGVRGTFPNEADVESMMKRIIDNRWRIECPKCYHPIPH